MPLKSGGIAASGRNAARRKRCFPSKRSSRRDISCGILCSWFAAPALHRVQWRRPAHRSGGEFQPSHRLDHFHQNGLGIVVDQAVTSAPIRSGLATAQAALALPSGNRLPGKPLPTRRTPCAVLRVSPWLLGKRRCQAEGGASGSGTASPRRWHARVARLFAGVGAHLTAPCAGRGGVIADLPLAFIRRTSSPIGAEPARFDEHNLDAQRFGIGIDAH